MSNEVMLYQEMEKKALAVAKSGLFGVKTPEQAVALFLVAEAENIPIMQAVLDYHIIDNKPSLKSDAMLRRFQSSGGIVKWVERTDAKVSAYFSHPSCPEPVLIDWDIERAKKAGLADRVQKDGKPNMWQKFPRQMLTARVISEGIRATAPGAASGIYTPEEVVDFEPSKSTTVTEPVADKPMAQDAEVVHTATPAPIQGISNKAYTRFDMAKNALGEDEFKSILSKHGHTIIHQIKDDDEANVILREMRVAFEAKQSAKKEVANV